MYLAEWLGKLGSVPVALVLLDSRVRRTRTRVVTSTERLASY